MQKKGKLITMSKVFLSGLIRNVSLHYPKNLAIDSFQEKITYEEIELRTAKLALSLRTKFGLLSGCKVALAMENCSDFLVILIACWRAGLVVVPINFKLHAKEFEYIFADAKVSLVFASEPIATQLETTRDIITIGTRDYKNLFLGDYYSDQNFSLTEEAWIFYTSGTTGTPKGAVLTHQNLLHMCFSYYADIEFVAHDETILHAAPMSHGSGLYGLPFLLKGAQNAIPESGQFDPDSIFDAIKKYKKLSFFAAPTMIKKLVESSRADENLSNLRTLTYGGGPMYLADCKDALNVFGPVMYQLYGQGESPMTITGVSKIMHQEPNREKLDHILTSVGIARTGVEIAVVGSDGKVLPSGGVGEIITKSQCTMSGYFNNMTATEMAIKNDWLYTGDIGTIDQRGILTLKDRSKDMIISGGSNIYPREVEDILITFPSIKEVAVVGRRNNYWGESAVAFVVGEAEENDLIEFCKKSLAGFKVPREYIFIEELPKNNYGKIVKKELRERLVEENK